MQLGIAGRVALVTGASKGIGFAVARGLAAEGVRVAMSARNEDTLASAVEAIRLAGGEACGEPADVSRPEQIEALLDRVRRRQGDPEILVVNAGGPPPGVPSVLGEADWAYGYELTLMSAVRLARAALPAMRERHWGRIINITSLSVKEPLLTLTLSSAYRAAVTGFSKTLAKEVAADGVTVNGVGPGYTATERLDELFADEEARETLLETIPAQRFGTPDEVAAVVVFLASQQAAYITGQTVFPDGGVMGAVH